MFDDTKNYVAPSVTVLNQSTDETVVTSGDADFGFANKPDWLPED